MAGDRLPRLRGHAGQGRRLHSDRNWATDLTPVRRRVPHPNLCLNTSQQLDGRRPLTPTARTCRSREAIAFRSKLGNGFDPGPPARAASKPLFDYLATVGWPATAYPDCADMQVKGGDCILKSEDEAAF